MLKFLILTLSLLVLSTFALNQTFSIYEGIDCSGNSLILTRRVADFGEFGNFTNIARSFRTTGWWKTYYGLNFTSYSFDYFGFVDYCFNSWSSDYSKSIKHLGARDTDTTSLALYSDINYEGVELLINYASESTLPFHSTSLFVTGHSNWTLFERENFEGASVCFESTQNEEAIPEISYFNWDITTIGSVRRGCEDVCASWKPTTRVQAPVIVQKDNINNLQLK